METGPRGAESRQAYGAKWRQTPGSEVETGLWGEVETAPGERSGGTTAARPRREASLPCKTKRTDGAEQAGNKARRRHGIRRGCAVEQGEATPWNKARRRGGAKWKAHGSVAADRVDAVQHADATKEAALRVQRGGKSVPSPTGSLQGIPSECLQPPLKGSTVRPLPCRRRIAPVNARGPLDVAGPFVAVPFDGCQSFHACAHATGGGASPTLRPAWP